MKRVRASVVVLTAAMTISSCGRTAAKSNIEHPSASSSPDENRPSFGTVLVDFSASFSPLTQTDRAALNESAGTLADLATKEWSPPVTIVWKRIGTNSAASKLLCGPFDFNRHLVARSAGASEDPEKLRSSLKQCAETVVRSSHRPNKQLEQYTDLTGAIATASQDWADEKGNKALLILSDYLPDYRHGTAAANLRLHGERVVMLHRVGNTDAPEVTTYLARINGFRESLLRAGAKSVALVPTFRATKATISQALRGRAGSSGVTISILDDLRPARNDDSLSRAISVLSDVLAKRTLEWPSPVVLTWFATGPDGRHTNYSVPIEFTPHLVHRTADSPGDASSPDDFRTGIQELGNAMVKRANGNGDIIGALKMLSEGDSEPASFRVTIVLSDLSRRPSSNATPLNLKGHRVIILYRPSVDSATFQTNLEDWKSYLRSSGSSQICALNLENITASQQFCLSDEVPEQ